MAYIGNTVENQGFTPAIDYFNGNGVTVTFTLSRPVASVAQMIVAIDNVIQNPSSSYTVAGNAITFSSAPLSGTNNIWVEYTSLITTYQGISQDPTVIGDIRATGGYLAEGDFGNSFVAGAIFDYVTGLGRVTVGTAEGIALYNGGTASRTALASWNSSGTLTNTGGAVIQGLTVGKGGGSATNNTAVGASALAATNTGGYSTAVGATALTANTSGQQNNAFGSVAAYTNTTGSYLVAMGNAALFSNTTGSNNTGLGHNALYSNTTGSESTAVGYQAGYSNVSGFITVLGYRAGYSSTGNAVVYVGYNAGVNATGNSNTFIGSSAGEAVTSGAANTIVGRFNGNQGGLDIRTASNYIVLSDGGGNPYAYWGSTGQATFRSVGVDNLFTLTSSAGAFSSRIQLDCTGGGGAVVASTSNVLTCQTGGTGGVNLGSGATSWVSASDERVKENLVPITGAANKVASLRAVTGNYIWDESKKSRAFLIAQDVLEVLPEAVETKNPDELGLAYTDVIPLLVAAIKEQQAIITDLKARIEALEAK